MIIYNTTFSVNADAAEDFLAWLRKEVIPLAVESGELTLPQITRILSQEDETHNYSLQFHVESVDVLEHWYQHTGSEKLQELQTKYSNKVAGFTTLMSLLDLE